MNISICITVKNEEKSIGRLIESLLGQTLLPNEIIICDGNSTDKTFDLLQQIKLLPAFAKATAGAMRLKILRTSRKGIAAGRNTAIENASNDIVAMIDAGCVAKSDWLEKLTEPFKIHPGGAKAHPRGVFIMLVAGFYEMPYKNPLQQVLSIYHGITPERYNEQIFIPSARSVAFTKSIWQKVGKFNEQLEKAGEDTEFFYKCVKSGAKIIRIKEARVVWEEISTWSLVDGIKKFYDYAKGDAQIHTSHNIKIGLIFLRYIFGLILFVFGFNYPLIHLILFILVLLYLLYPLYKWHDIIKSVQGRLWLPIVQIGSDLAVMAGFMSGMI